MRRQSGVLEILLVVGARPNFIKIAPIAAELRRRPELFSSPIVHTGQHYDSSMSDSFFADLDIPHPDIFLNVGSATHAQQTAEILRRFEPVLAEAEPDYVLVVGDVNSTLACALTAAKMEIPVIHVEAGLRSFDRTMPEEINRVLTDHLSELLFVTEESGRANLLHEGIPAERIHFVGNVMIDSLQSRLEAASRSDVLERCGLRPGAYGLVTLHRPSNVDEAPILEGILKSLATLSEEIPLLLPMHPRTRAQVRAFAFEKYFSGQMDAGISRRGLYASPPLGYVEFLQLMKNARLVLTDSGGIQEETTALSVPCLTLRDNTERPSTVEIGSNRLVGTDPERILNASREVLSSFGNRAGVPPLWDGRTASRIVEVLKQAGEGRPVRISPTVTERAGK